MTRLVISPDTDPGTTLLDTSDAATIAAELGAIGVRFEQWDAGVVLPAGAGQDEVLAAYAADIERLSTEGGFVTVDVVRMARSTETDAEWAEKAAGARGKFLAEHTHDDDEIRFFVEGSGAFYLRVGGRVHVVMCEQGDLLSVPANTTHWFDTGVDPHFAAIRFFRVPEGWVGRFTGDDIATRFPSFDTLRQAA